MLDSLSFTVKHVFKVFARIDRSLAALGAAGGELFISSTLSRAILQDIVDVYLAHLYSQAIYRQLVESVITDALNPCLLAQDQAPLDPTEFADFAMIHGREYGVGQDSFYFGRAPALQRVASCPDAVEGDSGAYVYTAATQRLLEQVCMSLQFRESILLVGETGTGKTASVQEIARLRGCKLHVFNMNQNTDSSDLLGGFKPVDIKYLLKPVYQHFLQLFKKLFKSDKNQDFLDLMQKCYE